METMIEESVNDGPVRLSFPMSRDDREMAHAGSENFSRGHERAGTTVAQ
ncbi:hypothetical protein BURMUCF2_1151 [Burkholderia multivorans CF2]|nr:hypothetical protein BURMUCF2_1151 [Burkholderia multivorans CF2]